MKTEIIKDVDVAWAAGLFEGEGCFTQAITDGKYLQIRAKLNMIDEDVVRRFHSIVKVGTVIYVKPRESHHKPQYQWYCQTLFNVKTVLDLFYPYLGERRRKQGNKLMNNMKEYLENLGRPTKTKAQGRKLNN